MRWGKYGVQNASSLIRLDMILSLRIHHSFIFLFVVTGLLLTSPFAINDAFANHLSNELKWQLVFIASTPACSNNNYQMMETYYDAAKQYLNLYELEHISYAPLCITEQKYLTNYKNPYDLDLIILVYDKDLGEKELHANQMGGLYSHSGNDRAKNHVIIFCDCSNFYYSSPVWILSHELSHFILYYKDFEMAVIERLIHVNDARYDQCLNDSTQCESSSIKMVAGPGSYAYSVMPIYQPAVGKHVDNKVILDEYVYPISSELSKIITTWWATDVISDEQYSNALKYLVNSNILSSYEGSEIILTDEPLNNIVTWEQMMEEVTPTYWGSQPKSDVDKIEYLSKIPHNMKSSDKILLSEEMNNGLPEWFKQTATMWGQDMITNEEFNKNIEYLANEGIIETYTSNVFQDLTVDSTEELAGVSIEEKVSHTLPEWFVVNAEWWAEGHITEKEFNNNLEYLIDAGIIESYTSIVFKNEVVPESLRVSHSVQLPNDDKNTPESLSTDPISNESSEIQTKNENIAYAPLNMGGVHEFSKFVNSIPDIDDRVPQILEAVVNASNEGNIELMCNNLKYFNLIIENLIDSNDIDQALGQSLIAEGVLIKADLCNN